MIFTVGNLITLGIVAFTLILYRLADKNNRPLEKVKKYAEKCKEEIAAYAEEKSMAVKNFGIDLDVERKSALQLMKNIQQLTEEELGKKSESIFRIEEHIKAFESSLEELTGMTGRVQENLNRIRDESAFVESTGKKVSEAKEKLEQVERALITAGKNLEETQEQLERKNAQTLEQTALEVISSAKSVVADFETTAHVIERKIEEHREAVIKTEREREAVLSRDLEIAKKTMRDVLENAGKRADKMEEAALVKLREQAQDRVGQTKVFFEEKLKILQEHLKTEHVSISEKLKNIHDKSNAEILDISGKQKSFHQEWVKGSAELDSMAKKQREEIISSLARQQDDVKESITKERDTINAALMQQQSDWKQNFLEFRKLTEKQRRDLEISVNTSKQELNQSITELKIKSSAALKQQQDELDAAIKGHQKDITSVITELKEKSGAALKNQQQETGDVLSRLNSSLSELQVQSKSLQKQQQEELASVLSDLRQKSNSAIAQQQSELSSILGELRDKSNTVITAQQEELSAALSEMKQNAASSVSKQQSELSAALSELKQNTASSVSKQQGELTAALKAHQQELSAALSELREKSSSAVSNQHDDINSAMKEQMDSWKLLCRDTGQDIIAANEKRLEEYSRIQNEAVKQLNSLADDAGKLESELRHSMKDSVERVKKDFSQFEKDSKAGMENTADAFKAQAQVLQKELEDMNSELNRIKQQAFDNVSEKLSVFESDFALDLGKRTTEVNRQITDWQAGMQQRLDDKSDKLSVEWEKAEEKIAFDQRRDVSLLAEKLTSDLERLKDEAVAFEKGIREEMESVDNTRQSFTDELKHNLADIRASSENELKTQVGQYQISMQETLRQKQRELEKEIAQIAEHSKTSYAALDETALNTRQTYDEWQNSYNARMRDMDNSLEELRKNNRTAATENEERVSSLRQNLDDIRKELGIQKKIHDQTTEMKKELENRIEEINTDLNRLDQRKSEITELENEFTHIKKNVEDMNRKMTSFLTEKHRLDVMQKDFERLIKTSQSVEEKLVQVTTSDDVLQAVQVQIRKLEDSIKVNDEKYQRIERKNEVLEQTNEGIDRNFKSIQKTETAIKNAEKIINVLSDQFDKLSSSIEALAAESNKATDAVDKISVLDDSLSQIEKRITEMNVAREWLARIEKEFKTLDKDAREHLKLAKGLISGKSASAEKSKGAATPQDRDNVLRLKSQGWTVDEIANSMHLGKGEVELILEIGSRD